MNFNHFAIPLLAVTVAILIVAEIRGVNRLIYVFKPLSTLLVIAIGIIGAVKGGLGGAYSSLIVSGLILSLGGDIALMPPDRPHRFRLGLVLFLLAHLAYIVAFWNLGSWQPVDLIIAMVLLFLGFSYFMLLRPQLGSMMLPVVVYILIISLMVSRAGSTLFLSGFNPYKARLIAIGAVLFFLSDMMLAANRFWKPWRFERSSLAFYFSGQLCFALSVGV